MASLSQPRLQSPPAQAVAFLSSTYYFAYGSNLCMSQMKRRCPNSKFIGKARLFNYRWHINERGYANVRPAKGHWVDGLVYEVDTSDEATLDICEGVSKNAYSKCYIGVLLHRANTALYGRSVSWIVDQGGPAAVCKQAKAKSQRAEAKNSPRMIGNVLTYLNINLTRDSRPKEEYVKRINQGIADARALGIDEDYISTYVRPFIPETMLDPTSSGLRPSKAKSASPARGRKTHTPAQSGDLALVRKGRTLSLPPERRKDARSVSRGKSKDQDNNITESVRHNRSTLLQPQMPSKSARELPLIVIEESIYSASFYSSSWRWWPST